MALGHLASFSPELSTAVISSNALPPLVDVLEHEDEDHVKGASAWSLGQIGKHTPVHAKEVALVGTMLHLVVCAKTKRTSEDLRKKCEFSIKSIVNRLEYTPALDSLLNVSERFSNEKIFYLQRGIFCSSSITIISSCSMHPVILFYLTDFSLLGSNNA